jgi:hypothetical protein
MQRAVNYHGARVEYAVVLGTDPVTAELTKSRTVLDADDLVVPAALHVSGDETLAVVLMPDGDWLAFAVLDDEDSAPRLRGPYTAAAAGIAAGGSDTDTVTHDLGLDADSYALSGHLTSGARVTWRATTTDDDVTVTFYNLGAAPTDAELRFFLVVSDA